MSMNSAPRSVRLHIGIFGRTNVGKSTFLNMITDQSVSITSEQPGTTTDVVEKQMELLPLGPVVFHDTAGLDDASGLAGKRLEKTRRALAGIDVAVLVVEPGCWSEYEKKLLAELEDRELPFVLVVNKLDLEAPSPQFKEKLEARAENIIYCSSLEPDNRDEYINAFKRELIEICPEDFLNPPTLVGDLIPAGEVGVLVVPIDLEAPKGRLILPQVQTIRNALDNDATTLVAKDNRYPQVLDKLEASPAIVICDSQVVQKMVENTPPEVSCTTFSILFARQKGDLPVLASGAAKIHALQPGARVLIGEACSHHPIEGDIGREKIPRWLTEFVGGELDFDVYSGQDFPDDLNSYDLIVHCGGCMINRRRMLFRLQRAREAGVPVTNYGICISLVHEALDRTLSPFPAALQAYGNQLEEVK